MFVGFAVGRSLVRPAGAVRQVEDGAPALQPLVCHAGVWERVFAALTADRDNQYLMIDSTIVRAHQQAASGKGGPKIRRWGAPEAD
jgi:transposase